MASSTSADKLAPNDGRVEHHTTQVRGRNYYYMLARPAAGTTAKGTILLVHGFPDMAFGWRHQVLFLAAQGFQVVVPDKLGYGRTDAPAEVEPYRMKSVIDDLLALVDQQDLVVGGGREKRLVLGGHDWGGQVVWRFTEWHPDRVAATFSVCTPFFAPHETYVDLPTLTRLIPNFGYQLQFASEELVERTSGPGGRAATRDLLNALWGGGARQGDDTTHAFSTAAGVDFDAARGLPRSPILQEDELEFYVEQYSRSGLRGPTNWYRTRRVNWEDECELVERRKRHEAETGAPFRIKTPSLFIAATRDAALPPAMSNNMDDSFERLSRGEVEASHWALIEAADEVNRLIINFLDDVMKPKAAI